jgi:purine-cytosine permease-like protein
VFSVTALPPSLRDDQGERMRRYLVSMGIRTVCFIGAVVALAVFHWTVVGWTMVIAAMILPYIAVVMANATRYRRSTTLGPVRPNGYSAPPISPRLPPEEPTP